MLSNTLQEGETASNALGATLLKLKEKLTKAYSVLIESSLRDQGSLVAASNTEHAAVKRTLKIVLLMLKRDCMLGDPLSFKTIKDRLIYQAIKGQYIGGGVTLPANLEQVRSHLKALGNIREKRSQQYFKLIQSDHSDLVAKMTQAYLQAVQSSETEKSST